MHEKQIIKQYCNMSIGSDCYPYEVVKIISDKTVEVRPMESTLIKAPCEFYPGGFVGHYADNYSQEYTYQSAPDAKPIRIRWSERKCRWANGFWMSDRPCRFYDYNF
jgi:hypothetical protein